MAVNKFSIFACGNGDAILLEADGKTVMTDINYCDSAADPDDDSRPDFGAEIRAACTSHHLSVFVLTHPDVDHCRGFSDIFHVGDPSTREDNPEEGHVKIIVDEIWCSPYGIAPNYVTGEAKALLDEIKRRHQLAGTETGKLNGNRLVVRSLDGDADGSLTTSVTWKLLAPTSAEATIPKQKDTDVDPPSSNASSLVLRWSVKVGGNDNLLLIGGDSTVDVWERIHKDNKAAPEDLSWHVLVAPHHCSRHALGRGADEDFTYSDDALEAIAHMKGRGHIVASSKAIQKGKSGPPHWEAKKKYVDNVPVADERFHCTGSHDDDKPGHVVFELTAGGPTLKPGSSRSYSGGNRVGGGGGYG